MSKKKPKPTIGWGIKYRWNDELAYEFFPNKSEYYEYLREHFLMTPREARRHFEWDVVRVRLVEEPAQP